MRIRTLLAAVALAATAVLGSASMAAADDADYFSSGTIEQTITHNGFTTSKTW
jgi:thiamine monophosphate synthase